MLKDIEEENAEAFAYYMCPYHPLNPAGHSAKDNWQSLPVEMNVEGLLPIHFVGVMRFLNYKVR